MADRLAIEVAYAGPEGQVIVPLSVPAGTTVGQAVELARASGLPLALSVDPDRLGIFSRRVDVTRLLEQGDRVEIYRPLTIDPMDARRRRASRGA
ncbi:hypothetical protein EC912_11323 [Luteibacter rhizovicinus]|uniref:UPF0125 protein EC912_11323 n=1 Tax=Luteibacter rhizovicinus TaxID=242606 RepID=A0A4R3YGT5_9GAMM|nr:RnfH family protein [Luteibacter rhizovicinus]TCV91172.1 hypothetical protein EC912_11323 [Luteibacter rhizovicinus]